MRSCVPQLTAVRIVRAFTFAVAVGMAGMGCVGTPGFPAPISVHAEGEDSVLSFDTDGDRLPDFWQYQGPDGRKYALDFSSRSEDAEQRIRLDQISADDCPHFIIVLDGVPFELVDELYREGYFRFFHPPSKVICCFPAMTDLALSRLFHAGRCRAYEARRFDRAANRFSDGAAVYLSGENSPWMEYMDYRCSFWWDGLAYLNPQAVFEHELKGMLAAFRKIDAGQAAAYSVGTAGLGTRGGREAILNYLITIDRLCERIIYERKGRANITVVADHGHNLVVNERVSFRKTLEAGGFRQTKSLHTPKDVAPAGYGLVTYAAFFTNEPERVAACLLNHPSVEFACYPDELGVAVRDQNGAAYIRQGSEGFIYDFQESDPLKLAAIERSLKQAGKVNERGEIDATALFAASAEHFYPDPLERIWGAFFNLVEFPPDVLVNLRDGSCYGSRLFAFMIGRVASTHGSLNRINSTTFVLTTLGELAPVMRSRDVLPALREASGAQPLLR